MARSVLPANTDETSGRAEAPKMLACCVVFQLSVVIAAQVLCHKVLQAAPHDGADANLLQPKQSERAWLAA